MMKEPDTLKDTRMLTGHQYFCMCLVDFIVCQLFLVYLNAKLIIAIMASTNICKKISSQTI